jgi:hypothetical protein
VGLSLHRTITAIPPTHRGTKAALPDHDIF